MASTEADFRQRLWYGRVVRLVKLMGYLESSDLLWKAIEPDLGACTKAYLDNDPVSWRLHALRIEARLACMPKGALECRPTWC